MRQVNRVTGLPKNPLIDFAELEQLHDGAASWALACCAYDIGEAEDVMQTSYLKIFDGSARFAGDSSLRTWFFAVIRNVARNHWRIRLRLSTRLPELPSEVEGPDRSAERDQRHKLVLSALAGLPRRQRETLELVFYRDFTVAEAARIMGISTGSASRHFDRGKRALAKRLDKVVPE